MLPAVLVLLLLLGHELEALPGAGWLCMLRHSASSAVSAAEAVVQRLQYCTPVLQARMREQGVAAEHGHKRERQEVAVPDGVPRALHRFFKK